MKKKSLLFILLLAIFAPLAMNAQAGLRPIKGLNARPEFELKEINTVNPQNEPSRLTQTVNNGTSTNSYMPLPGSNVGSGIETQFVIPASEMTDMVPDGYYANITAMSFAASTKTASFGSGQFIVLLQEIDYDSSDPGFFYSTSDMTIVYYGSLSISNRNMSITFNYVDDGFDYFGGDLLVCFYEYTNGSSATTSWYGTTDNSNYGAYWNGSSGYYSKFRPKATITYTRREATCVVPADLDLFGIDKTVAGLYWTERGQSTAWEVSYSTTSGDPDNGTIVSVSDDPYCILTDLTEGTIYYTYVRSICDGDTPTDWSAVCAFRTPDTCDQPFDVEVSNISQTTADLSWDGYDDSYDIRYRQQSGHDIANFLNNQVGSNITTTGTFTDYTFSLSSYSGRGYVAIRHYNVSDMFWLDVTSVTVKDSSNNTVFEGDLTNGIPDGWYAVDYDGDGYNWKANTGFVYSESYSNDAGVALNPDNWLITPMVPLGGSVVINAKGQDSNYPSEVFGIFVSTTIIPEYEWNLVENVNGYSYTIPELKPEITYEAQVRAHNCTVADWSDAISFTTLSGCDAPAGLNTTNITATTATLNWAEALSKYNVRYKKGFAYDFDSAEPWVVDDFGPCTTYDGDGSATGGFQNVSFTHQGYIGSFIAFQNGVVNGLVSHSGNACGACIYATTPPNNDFFILPEITIERGYVFSFWAKGYSSTYSESFKVGVYGADGTLTSYLAGSASTSVTPTTEWTEYSYDLSSYVGQTIKLAINCVSNDAFVFMIDDIYVGISEWSEPIVCEGGSYKLEGLESETDYVWQVQGVDCDGDGNNTDWSTMGAFTTLFGMSKTITGFGTDDGGYYLIASPVTESTTATADNGFLTKAFDLYKFNESADLEWENWQQTGDHYQFPIVNGNGYLYASSTTTTLMFSGTQYTGNGQVTLAKTDNVDFSGWNLVGNPFAETAYIGNRDFYVMNYGENTGGSEIIASNRNNINAMEGIFVIAEENGETLTFTTTAPTKAADSKVVLNIVGNNGKVIDRAIIRFGEGNTLPKFMIDENNTKIYIPMADANYAVVRNNNQDNMPVNFKAANSGKYTISVETEGINTNYMHLIDRLTGEDVNILTTPEYSFVSSTMDAENRFVVRFSETAANSVFAYQSGNDIIVNGNGELQVFDIMGRMVMNTTVNGTTTVNLPSNAVYIFRMVGETVNTQKIVVR